METARQHTLKKYEIVRGKKYISTLFSSGRSMKGRFIKAVYVPIDVHTRSNRCLPMVLYVVGRKLRPDAVDRNRIRRLMKEAYRHEKPAARRCAQRLAGEKDRKLCIAFIFTGRGKKLPSPERFRDEIRTLLTGIAASGYQ